MTLFLEALVATVAAFFLFVCLTTLGEKLYMECKKAEKDGEDEKTDTNDATKSGEKEKFKENSKRSKDGEEPLEKKK